jgi:hypothetical protein
VPNPITPAAAAKKILKNIFCDINAYFAMAYGASPAQLGAKAGNGSTRSRPA